MSFKAVVQQYIAGFNSKSPLIPGLFVGTGENQGCVRLLVAVAA
jgi:hypothetical protein